MNGLRRLGFKTLGTDEGREDWRDRGNGRRRDWQQSSNPEILFVLTMTSGGTPACNYTCETHTHINKS